MAQVGYELPPFLVTLLAILKACILIPKTRQISEFIRELGSIWRTKFTANQTKEKNTLLRKLEFCKRANTLVAVWGTVQYFLSPLLETIVRRLILEQNDAEFMLAMTSSYPFDPAKNWLVYILVFSFQFFTMIHLTSVYMGAELLMMTTCALLGVEFLMLKDDLSRVKPTLKKERYGEASNDDEDDGITIEEIVKRHQTLRRISRLLDSAFNRLVFLDLLFVGITTCAFSFAGKFSQGLTYMVNNYVGMASNMMPVLYLCYYGEVLMGASASIGDMAYETLWYKGSKEYQKVIWLIIKISQTPCCLTSLQYTVVSLNLFTKVISTTWSYFSLMNTVYSE